MKKLIIILALIAPTTLFSQQIGLWGQFSDSVSVRNGGSEVIVLPTGITMPDGSILDKATVDSSEYSYNSATSDTSSFSTKSDSSNYADTSGYALNGGSLDSLYFTDTKTWITDTIPIYDSTWNTLTASDSIMTPKINTESIFSESSITVEAIGTGEIIMNTNRDFEINSRNLEATLTGYIDISSTGPSLIQNVRSPVSSEIGLNDNGGGILLRTYSDETFTTESSTISLNNTQIGGISYWRNKYNSINHIFQFDSGIWQIIEGGDFYFRVNSDSLHHNKKISTKLLVSEKISSDTNIIGGDTITGFTPAKAYIESETFDNILLTKGLITDNDATPDVSGGSIFTYNGTANAVTVTDFDSPVIGNIYTIIGNSDTYTITINDSGNFNLSANWVGGVDDVITIYVQSDNDYIEISRSDN